MRPEEIDDVIGQVVRLVEERYVFPDAGAAVCELLRDRVAGWRADQPEPAAFAKEVTAVLQSVNSDGHLSLNYMADELPEEYDQARLTAEFAELAARNTGGVGRVERLAGNIGYLELSPILYHLAASAEAIAGAFAILANTDALILDVRATDGGSPEAVQFVCGYLFDESVHLNSIEERGGANLWQSWSLPYVPGRRFGETKPVYVLTSGFTFSGAEDLAYGLRQRERAVLVGERTGGGAHPCAKHRVHPHLRASPPTSPNHNLRAFDPSADRHQLGRHRNHARRGGSGRAGAGRGGQAGDRAAGSAGHGGTVGRENPMRADEIDDVTGQVVRLVEEHYVFPDACAAVAKALEAAAAGWRADPPEEPEAFAVAVTKELQSVNGDKHLRLQHSAGELPEEYDEAQMLAEMTEEAARHTGGVARVERLAGNVGYLELSPVLYPLQMSAEAITGAFTILSTTDTLILDLRSNGGGSPETVQFACSYLFDESVHLNSIEERAGANLWQSWSLPYVPGRRFGGTKPVYVLTSTSTFSGAEELTYNLQQRERALIVGETTKGGAHPCKRFKVHPHLRATIPFARSIHPLTGTNWEGTGIRPDVEVPAAEALDEAIRLAAAQPISAGR